LELKWGPAAGSFTSLQLSRCLPYVYSCIFYECNPLIF